jgi:hypothetical protein
MTVVKNNNDLGENLHGQAHGERPPGLVLAIMPSEEISRWRLARAGETGDWWSLQREVLKHCPIWKDMQAKTIL